MAQSGETKTNPLLLSKRTLLTIFCVFLWIESSDSNTPGNHTNSTTRSLIEASDKPFRCYTCSWGESSNLTAPNIDVCSSYRFVPEAASIVACDYGCQAVSYRVTKTGGMMKKQKHLRV